MQDLYGSTKRLAGAFKGTTAALTVGNTGGALRGALVQNISMAYNRQVTRILELGSENQYYVTGQAQGQGQIGAILGPRNVVISMLKSLADECTAASRIVAFQVVSDFCGEDGGTGELTAKVSGSLLTGINISVSAQDFLVQQGGQFMFVAMELDGSAPTGVG